MTKTLLTFSLAALMAVGVIAQTVITVHPGETITITVSGVDATPTVPPPPPPPPPPITHLVQPTDLQYIGSFLAPSWNGADNIDTLSYGGYGMAFNAANNSLFVIGHIQNNRVGEITIPATLSMDLPTMKRATWLQHPQEVTEGQRFGDVLAGLLVYHDRLISSSRVSYDANSSQNVLKKSHYVSGLNLSQLGDAKGPLGITAVKTNYLTGYMTPIPQAWQSTLGGPALTGWCCGPSIVGRTSIGPGVSAFDPDQLGVIDPVPGTTLLYYPEDHATLGAWSAPTPWPPVVGQGENHRYNGTTEINGIAFPEGTNSILFFGVNGYGVFCYGDTTNDINKVYTVNPLGGQRYCTQRPGPDQGHSFFSIDSSNKGSLAPYKFQVWAYDAADMAEVKGGTKKPWEIIPYAYWTLDIPGMEWVNGARLRGVAYDPSLNRIYMYQQAGSDVIIRVLQVK